MSLSSLRSFNKGLSCPSATELVTYSCEDLSSKEMERVRLHLFQCDFCCAELSLLKRHPPVSEEVLTPIMPNHLRLLAKALLTCRGPARQVGTEMTAYEMSA
jgi:hypothetical protein